VCKKFRKKIPLKIKRETENKQDGCSGSYFILLLLLLLLLLLRGEGNRKNRQCCEALLSVPARVCGKGRLETRLRVGKWAAGIVKQRKEVECLD